MQLILAPSPFYRLAGSEHFGIACLYRGNRFGAGREHRRRPQIVTINYEACAHRQSEHIAKLQRDIVDRELLREHCLLSIEICRVRLQSRNVEGFAFGDCPPRRKGVRHDSHTHVRWQYLASKNSVAFLGRVSTI